MISSSLDNADCAALLQDADAPDQYAARQDNWQRGPQPVPHNRYQSDLANHPVPRRLARERRDRRCTYSRVHRIADRFLYDDERDNPYQQRYNVCVRVTNSEAITDEHFVIWPPQ